LLVDDDEFVLKATESFLHSYGVVVEAVSSSKNALEKFSELRIDLVILDVNLGGVDGVTTYRALRKKSKTLPILLCSGDFISAETADIKDDKHVMFLRKPYEPEKFLIEISLLIS